jgi:serine/threonine protein kinase
MTAWNTNQPRALNGGRYAIDKVFADSGGMGVIYAARDTRCANNPVLIKATRYDGGDNARRFGYTRDEAVKHVKRLRSILEWEKKILVRFKNENINNIPSINDFFYDQSLLLQPSYQGKREAYSLGDEVLLTEPYLVMERMYGDTLEHLLKAPGFRDEKMEVRLLKLSKEILTIFIRMHRRFAVQQHQAYFIYQDLKPANILVGKADYFTLIDLGSVTLRLTDKTTEPTAGMLTYGYAPPEGEREGGVHIDQRFDLYTLGVTLYQAVTGIDPRELGQNFPKLDLGLLQRAGLRPLTLQILTRALERDPDRRYTHAAEMRKDVVQALRELGEAT